MFNVGDTVIVCDKPPSIGYTSNYMWIWEMNNTCGKEYKINSITKDGYYYLSSCFYYHKSWIKSPVPVVPIVKISDMGML